MTGMRMNVLDVESGFDVDESDDAGIYTWDIPANTLFADAALADLFGLDPSETKRGLPLERYFERVHRDDRNDLGHAIRRAIEGDQPFQENYRVHRADNSIAHIMAFGRVFRDAIGEPCRFSGIVFPMPVEQRVENQLLWHCLCAYDLARAEGRTDVMHQVRKILMDLSWRGAEEDQAVCF